MPKSLRYALMIFLGGALYGAMLPLIRISYDFGFTPTSGMLIQNILAFVILTAIALSFYRSKLSPKQTLQLLCIGAVTYIMSFTYFLALQHISATACITLMFQYIWIGIVIDAIYERKMPRLLTILACLIVMFGTTLTTGILEEDLNLNFIGIALALVSALAYAAFLFLSKHIATEVSSVTRTAVMTSSRLLLAVVVFPLFAQSTLPTALPLVGIGILLALGGIVLPVMLIQKAAPHLPGPVTMIMSASELPSAVILSTLFINEVISPMAIVGIILILGGIVLSQLPELVILTRRILPRRTQA